MPAKPPYSSTGSSASGAIRAQGNLTFEFQKQFEVLLLAKNRLARLRDATTNEYKAALYEFLNAMVSYRFRCSS
jgi:hypothetical protein